MSHIYDKLMKCKDLLNAGIIMQDEFNELKRHLVFSNE